MNATVKLREENTTKDVTITSKNKPKISKSIKNKWQRIINLIASIFEVPAGLVMQITNSHMEVFLKSQNKENPYPEDGKDSLLHGLYCETVIGKDQELEVQNSLQDKAWEDNPDVKLNMISYYGLPIKWQDGEFFGTICVLDSEERHFNDKYKELLLQFKETIETDLYLIQLQDELTTIAETDELTGIYNRRKLMSTLTNFIENYKRYNHIFYTVMMDIDHFKEINDTYGHKVGDNVLQEFSNVILKRIRTSDVFARYGGDEFILFLHEINEEELQSLLQDITTSLKTTDSLKQYNIELSYGYSSISKDNDTVDSILQEADNMLYTQKRNQLNN